MKTQIKTAVWAFMTALFLSACQKETRESTMEEEEIAGEDATARQQGNSHDNDKGHVYTISNKADGNKVLAYRRSSNGRLNFDKAYLTGGNGSGAGLGSQGAVLLTMEKKFLLVVNAGSNSISSFRVTDNGLQLRCTINSGGTQPISITEHDNIVYVLNAGGNGNISGFRLLYDGTLRKIQHSTRPLSSNNPGPAQISFVQDGKVLVITEKATNTIITYRLNGWNIPGAVHTLTSANKTPFGFATGRNGNIYVSEAAGGAPGLSTLSSYRVSENGAISLTEGPVAANQTAACWVVLTGNGKFAYATNTGSNSVSSFRVNNHTGNIEVREAVAGATQGGPIDAALSKNSKFLYVLNAVGHSISAFSVGNNGSLNNIQTVTGLPENAGGLAAN